MNLQEVINNAAERETAVREICKTIDLLDRQGIIEILRHVAGSLENKSVVEINYKALAENGPKPALVRLKNDLQPLPPISTPAKRKANRVARAKTSYKKTLVPLLREDKPKPTKKKPAVAKNHRSPPSPQQKKVLDAINSEGSTAMDLRRATGLSSQIISAALNKLREKGHVKGPWNKIWELA